MNGEMPLPDYNITSKNKFEQDKAWGRKPLMALPFNLEYMEY
jgi:hypothetical protein